MGFPNEREKYEWEKWLDAWKEQAARASIETDTRRQMPTPPGFPFRDPSVRDVLAQLDRIEAKLDELALKR